MINESIVINIINTAKQKAVRALIRDFSEIQYLRSSKKPLDQFVKYAFSRSEQLVYDALLEARPTYSILSKAQGHKIGEDGKYRWLISSLTSHDNFAHGLPYFAISVALEAEGKIIIAVVDVIALGETYFAVKGSGAWVERNTNLTNDKMRLRVSNNNDLHSALILADQNTATDLVKKRNTRLFGCAAVNMAYIAAGKADVFVGSEVHLCDVAAGLLLVGEAGGTVVNYIMDDKNIINKIIASNHEIFSKAEAEFSVLASSKL